MGVEITEVPDSSIAQFFMPDPAEQLQKIYLAGFELKTFDRFPKCVGVVRDNCIALLVPTPDGLQMLGTPGWEIGEVMGVLTEVGGRKVFQAKQEIIEATPERLERLRRFREELHDLLRDSDRKKPITSEDAEFKKR
ncbi:MAG TPA: hypothetical protein VEF05_18675 [Terriglobales bacterium]|nr:hypothetical protein [Terriglobales bacterium]